MKLGWLKGLVVPLVVLVVWEICSRSGIFSAIVLPAPSQVAVKWWQGLQPVGTQASHGSYLGWLFSGEMWGDAWSSFMRVVVGFVIGTILALPLGLWMGASKTVHDLMNPLLQVLRPIPPIAYIPLAMIWFGLGNPPAFFLIALGAFFPVLMNTIAGVRHVDGIYLRAAKNLGARPLDIFVHVILPAATPYILTGVRIGIGTAFIVVIVAEMVAVNQGLGFRILEAREYFWSDKIIAGMITIGFLGLALDTIISRLNNYLLRWHRGLEH